MRVMLVEDDTELAREITAGLNGARIDVVHARTARDARRYVEIDSFEVLILDVMLPGESGFALCRFFLRIAKRQRKNQIRVAPGRFIMDIVRLHHQCKLVDPFGGHYRDIGVGPGFLGFDEQMAAARHDIPGLLIAHRDIADGFIGCELHMGRHAVGCGQAHDIGGVVVDDAHPRVKVAAARRDFRQGGA